MNKQKGHLNLEVWKLSIELVSELYQVTKDFPKYELYGLVSQIRRAGISIPANLAEGAARNGKKEFLHFIGISIGSGSELSTLLIISEKLRYLNENQFSNLMEKLDQISRMLAGLKKSLLTRYD